MARKFVFRFDTMLKIRRQREDHHKRIVADRLRQIAQVNRQLEGLAGQIQAEIEAMRRGQSVGTIDIQQVIQRRHWLGHLHRNTLEVEARRRFLEARLAQERAVLAEAAKQRRILEKLRERQWERHEQELKRQEIRDADELSTVRYVFDRIGDEVVEAGADAGGGDRGR